MNAQVSSKRRQRKPKGSAQAVSAAPKTPTTPRTRAKSERKQVAATEKAVERTVVKMSEAALVKSGVSVSAAKKLQEGRSLYTGPSVAECTVTGNPADFLLAAQVTALHICRVWPTIYLQPSVIALSDVNPTPASLVGYLFLAFLQRAHDLRLLNGALASQCTSIFSKEWVVPTNIAKFIEYYFRYQGPPVLQKQITIDNDYALPTAQVIGNNAPSPTNICVCKAPVTDANFNNFCVYPIIYDQGQTKDFMIFEVANGNTTLLTGGTALAGNSVYLQAISALLKGLDGVKTVAFKDIATDAPDCSSFGVPYGVNNLATDWQQYTGIMFPSVRGDPDMCLVLNANFNVSTTDVNPFPLGFQKCVPMATFQSFSSAATGAVTGPTSQLIQYSEWFAWLGLRNDYSPGIVFGKRGWRICGRKAPRLCSWVSREVDTFQLYRIFLTILNRYVASKVGISSPLLTDDVIANYLWYADNLIAAKVFDAGNPMLITGIGANATLSPQQLFPPVTPLNGMALLAIKAVIDQIGVVFNEGNLYVPTLCVNAFGTLADPALQLQNWPKTGFVCAASNRCIGSFTGPGFTNAFPFVAIDQIEQQANGTPVIGVGPNLSKGAGNLDSDQNYVGSTIANTATILPFIAGKALVNGHNPCYVFWTEPAVHIAQFVAQFFALSGINFSGLSARVNDGRKMLGGPSMVAVDIRVPVQDSATRSDGFNKTCLNVIGKPVVPASSNSFYHSFTRVNTYYTAPLSPSSIAMTLALPVAAIYRTNTTPFPYTCAFRDLYEQDQFNQVSDAFITDLCAVDGPVVEQYVADAQANHSKPTALLVSASKWNAFARADCLRKALIALGDRIGQQLTEPRIVHAVTVGCGIVAGAMGAGLAGEAGCRLIPHVYSAWKKFRQHYGNDEKKSGNRQWLTSPSVGWKFL